MRDLIVHPHGRATSFSLRYDNWLRRAKVPVLVINAATLNILLLLRASDNNVGATDSPEAATAAGSSPTRLFQGRIIVLRRTSLRIE